MDDLQSRIDDLETALREANENIRDAARAREDLVAAWDWLLAHYPDLSERHHAVQDMKKAVGALTGVDLRGTTGLSVVVTS